MEDIYKELLEKGWKLVGINNVSKMFFRDGYRFVLMPTSGVLIDKKNNHHPITTDIIQSIEDKILGIEGLSEK